MAPTTKPSGIPWLGEVPAHWEVKRLKHVARLRSGEAITFDAIEPEGDYAVLGGNGLRGFTTDFTHEGDYVLIGRQGALCGNINYGRGKFWASEHAIVCNPVTAVDHFWLGELLRSMDLNQYSQSAAQPGLAAERIEALRIPFPPLPEQRAIATFLDERTARIDGLIARKQRLVQLLKEKRQALITRAVTRGLDATVKLKESGVPWLGEVPEHWGVYPIKRGLEYLTDFEANGSFESVKKNVSFAESDGYAWYVRATDLQNGFIADPVECRWVDEPTYRFLERTSLVAGDLLVAKRGEIGKLYVMPAVDVPSTLAPNMYLLRLNERLHPVYAYYFLMSSSGQAELRLKDRSTTLGALYKDDCKEIMMFFPPLPEQLSIIEEIERSTLRIVALISKVEQAVLRLQEYRTALISAAVTGKVRVPH
ncbi:MAG: restriction endonuclease subunit S [Flavobacteriales bacterium]|nr:restriction endonuclease subunit S [Flavobacteriales bacterium]